MSESYYVYVLRCGDGSLYTGYTTDLERRLAQHGAGRGAKYTRARLPVALAGSWAVSERGEALRLERSIKRLKRRQKMGLLAGERVNQLPWQA